MTTMMRAICLLIIGFLFVSTDAFSLGILRATTSAAVPLGSPSQCLLGFQSSAGHHRRPCDATMLFMAQEKKDASRSGTKRERLDRLAELEDSRVETDKGFVVQAAGAFLALIVLGVAFAFVVQGPPI
jgi:hypothetical protein